MVTAASAADALDRLRGSVPLVQCITNSVVTGFTANVLLALGAAPAMVDNREEAPIFAAVADGVLINLGTLTGEHAETMASTARAAGAAGTPWVLDPVAVGGLPLRDRTAAELVSLRPHVIRGNASEIVSLAGGAGGGRGVDSGLATEAAIEAATTLAASAGAVAVSGATDRILDATGVVATISNGDPLMTKVTGVGCALGAVMAAFAACTDSAADAAFAATAVLTVAGDAAAEKSAGPGTFAVALLDALATLSPQDLARVRP